MATARIAITGMGSINALGVGVEAFAHGLRAGRCAIRTLSLFPTSGFRTTIAAEIEDLELPAWIPPAIARRASRSAMLALIAADEAWCTAGLARHDRNSVGVVIGTTTGGMATGEECFRRTLRQESPLRRSRLSDWLETPASVPADVLANGFGCRGPRLTVSTACSSGANALGLAADWIRSNRVATVLCGGTDSLCRMTYSGFNALQALDRQPCRPFDRDRAGLTLGEGAAMFVFEDWERARQRGARILGEFAGYGVSADAHHLTQPRPDGEGAMRAMRRALDEGGVAIDEIDYVNAHGTGTPLNDVVETRAIKAVFGARADRLPVSSTKSMIGHCLAAAGAIEALASLLALRQQFLPPTANLEQPDPECDLDYVPQASRSASLCTVLSNSYGFGGNNTSLILRAYDG
jgi:3-oxoacyl-[acyl-carrier-protein] synthase II